MCHLVKAASQFCSVLLVAKIALFATSFYCASHLVSGLIAGALKGQIDHGVLQGAPHVELQRKVVHPLQTGLGGGGGYG